MATVTVRRPGACGTSSTRASEAAGRPRLARAAAEALPPLLPPLLPLRVAEAGPGPEEAAPGAGPTSTTSSATWTTRTPRRLPLPAAAAARQSAGSVVAGGESTAPRPPDGHPVAQVVLLGEEAHRPLPVVGRPLGAVGHATRKSPSGRISLTTAKRTMLPCPLPTMTTTTTTWTWSLLRQLRMSPASARLSLTRMPMPMRRPAPTRRYRSKNPTRMTLMMPWWSTRRVVARPPSPHPPPQLRLRPAAASPGPRWDPRCRPPSRPPWRPGRLSRPPSPR